MTRIHPHLLQCILVSLPCQHNFGGLCIFVVTAHRRANRSCQSSKAQFFGNFKRYQQCSIAYVPLHYITTINNKMATMALLKYILVFEWNSRRYKCLAVSNWRSTWITLSIGTLKLLKNSQQVFFLSWGPEVAVNSVLT